MPAGDIIQCLQDAQPAWVQVAGNHTDTAGTAQRCIGGGTVFAGQKAAGQRVIRQHPELMLTRNGRQLVFVHRAVVQVVQRLQGFKAGQVVVGGNLQCLAQAAGAEIGRADRAHLALFDQARKGAQGRLQRFGRVFLMGLVQIDGVGLQPAQRAFQRGVDVARRQPRKFAPFAHLGGNQHLRAFATGLEPAPDQDLRFTAAVARCPGRIHIGGVDQVEAGLDKGIEQRKGGSLIHAPAKYVAAKGQRGGMKAGTAQLTGGHHGHVLLVLGAPA